MAEGKWRYCGACPRWVRTEDGRCTACGNETTAGRVNREKPDQQPLQKSPPADPRVVKPVANREVKPR